MTDYQLHHGDCLDVLSGMPDETYTAAFCDPPYGISFMNARWDHGVPSSDVWAEVLRVCKPGAVLLAFGGTRTWHRLAVNIEDAGWEIFDTIMWLYGSGFPKSMDIGKAIDKEAGEEREVVKKHDAPARSIYSQGVKEMPQNVNITKPATDAAHTWDGYGTALKPAHESIMCFRKPRTKTYAQHAVEDGTAALNVDGCRVPITDGATMARNNQDGDNGWKNSSGGPNNAALNGEPDGRWPANVVHDGSGEVIEVFERAGESPASARPNSKGKVYGNDSIQAWGYGAISHNSLYSDTGSAARFFYTAKASRAERNLGLEGTRLQADACNLRQQGGLSKAQKEYKIQNHHPTVKPLELCEYLARLIVPPESYRDDARLLVPFAGSGSEIMGAILAGWRNVDGIEIDAEYVEIAKRRVEYMARQARGEFRQIHANGAGYDDLPLFDAQGGADA